ncbi:DNA recombination protein RmuC [Candidatus Ruminimicrobium bovinum]|uniref:DNA recombination protein RmuC n=1 Tax=Candidatus Ruminimicrobium bovinum TaxID=3242779 RepID=UPI0039B894F2
MFVFLFVCTLGIAIHYYLKFKGEQLNSKNYIKEKENFLIDLGKYEQHKEIYEQQKEILKEKDLKIDDLDKQIKIYKMDLGKYEQQKETLKEKDLKIEELEKQIKNNQEKLSELYKKITAFEKDKEHLEKEKIQLEQIQKDLILNSKTVFEQVATGILKNTKEELTDTNKKELKNVVEPFEKNIKSFETTIQTQTKEFSQTRGALENELKNVINQGNQLKEQTSSLIDMFKTDSKAKGDFGETILQTILENSNLQEGVNYFFQKQKDSKRPDFQILLPGNKWIVIDSKVPLSAYMNYCNAKTDEEKNKFLDEHIEVIKTFIKDLSSKKYTEKFIENAKTISPDFTFMFIYPEEAYISALRYKPTLTDDAWKKDVAIVSATSLIHTIRIIEKLWDVQRQIENHEKIISIAKNLKTRIFSFIDNMATVSSNIITLNTNFNKFSNTVKGSRGLEKLVNDLSSYGIDSSHNKLDINKIKEINIEKAIEDSNNNESLS